MFLDLMQWPTASPEALFLFLITLFWLRYATRRDSLDAHHKPGGGEVAPWTFPYVFPLLGSMPLRHLWKPRDFVLDPNSFFQCSRPVHVKILTYEFYVVCGPENVTGLFKNSWACTSVPFVKFALGYAFGLPSKALSLYDKDNSSGGRLPHPDSTIEARNRVDYRSYESVNLFLEGKGLLPFWGRFSDGITKQLHKLHGRIGTDGVEGSTTPTSEAQKLLTCIQPQTSCSAGGQTS